MKFSTCYIHHILHIHLHSTSYFTTTFFSMGGPLQIHVHFHYTHNIQPHIKYMLRLEQLTASSQTSPCLYSGGQLHIIFHICILFHYTHNIQHHIKYTWSLDKLAASHANPLPTCTHGFRSTSYFTSTSSSSTHIISITTLGTWCL